MADEYGTVGLGAELDGDIVYHFCYQATEAWSLSVNTTGGTVSTTITHLDGRTSTYSGGSISLPASTFCYVKIEVTGGGTVSLS